jgi:hypothetical protein
MPIWDTLFGAGVRPVGEGVKAVFEGIGSFAKDIRTAVTGTAPIDATKLAELQAKAMEIEFMAGKMQADINLEEAKNPNVFVSGWRPFIGWICGFSLFYNYIFFPFYAYTAKLFYPAAPAMPSLDNGELISLLFALLGLAGFRSMDKKNGVAA